MGQCYSLKWAALAEVSILGDIQKWKDHVDRALQVSTVIKTWFKVLSKSIPTTLHPKKKKKKKYIFGSRT